MRVVTASRRTDLPAFYSEWFSARLRAGWAVATNPFNGKPYTVSLRREDVSAFVFFSRNYAPFRPALDELERRGYPFYLHLTITGLPPELQPRVIAAAEAAAQLRGLAARLGPERVQWRFDPVLLTDELGPDFCLARFRWLARALEGATARCYFSFTQMYRKVQRNLLRAGVTPLPGNVGERRALAQELADVARQHGMGIYACCQPELVGGLVLPGRCVDPEVLREIGAPLSARPSFGVARRGCGCLQGPDLGAYDTCPHGCVYCYANQDPALARRRLSTHAPDQPALLPSPTAGAPHLPARPGEAAPYQPAPTGRTKKVTG